MNEKILILGAGIIQVPIIKRAKSLGYVVLVLDGSADAPGMKLADHSFVISTLDAASALKVAIEYQVNAVLTTSDYPVNVVAKICAQLNLIGISPYAAEICTNKYLQRELAVNNGIQSPGYDKLNFNHLDHYTTKLNYPLIVKPLDSSASRGITIIHEESALPEAYAQAKLYSRTDEFLIEEFVGGKEYSLEGLVQDGRLHILGITEKFLEESEGMEFPVEIGHICSIVFAREIQEMISNFALSVIQAFQIDNSALHLEFKLNENQIYLIECACRPGGDFIASDLIPLSTGIDMLEALINIATGQKLNLKRSRDTYAGIKFLDRNNYGRLTDYLHQSPDPSISKFSIEEYKDVPLKSSLDRLGYFIASDKNKDRLIAILDGK
ncbi:ATP-grasp domain-containing protein [Sphingobacterium kitahiroshimense]|uniref:ATP-grasp domain-containing protein n=1 Tax=Sphingobacterium sp. B16(2022) TaxID=2914044 RepID=UPI00143CA793|nr:ATP-grasp domain-containing protein [Sphingobacterium sp. B16(2022)]NJI75022.1 ATP-grasp domain-containing protein [Sphingobacterium sp. B16(2022)]